MKELFQPGKKFTVTNPDHLLFEEEWTVETVSYPEITFSCWKRWCVDREYMLPTSMEQIWVRVIREWLGGVLLIDAHHIWQDIGWWIKGSEVSYLDQKMFQWYANRLDSQ